MMTILAFAVGVAVAPLFAEVPGVKQAHDFAFTVAAFVRTWITGKPE